MIRVCMLSLAVLLPLVLGPLAGAAEQAADVSAGEERDGWTPGLVVGLEVFDFAGNGQVTSNVRQDAFNAGRRTIESFRIGLDLQSPALDLPFVKPRLLGFGGVQVGPEYTVTMAKAGEFVTNEPLSSIEAEISCVFNPFCSPPPPPFSPIESFPGQGSQVDGIYEGIGWFAGVGTRFDVPGLGGRVRAKTAVTYLGEKVRATGRLVSATGAVAGLAFTIHNSVELAEEDFHYLGPTLGLDLVLAQNNRFEVTTFVDADLLWNVGDGQIDLVDPGIATYTFTAKEFRYMLQFGFRVAWKDAFGAR
jgi:hypothetical protein